jgi:hypothetical protein
MIDWESHRQAFNKHQKHRTILIKYANDIAPVGRIVSKYDPKYPAGCPSCSEENETQEHMMQCPCPKRQEWRHKLSDRITNILEEYHTPTPLQQLMLTGIQHSFGQQDLPNPTIHPTVESVAAAQNTIGWDQIMKGRWTSEWKTTQHEAMGRTETKHKNAQTWMTKLIHTIFKSWLELWKIRNEARHGRDWQSQRLAAKEQVSREITQLYDYKGQIMPSQEWIFNTALEQQLLKTVYVLRAFVSNYKPVI